MEVFSRKSGFFGAVSLLSLVIAAPAVHAQELASEGQSDSASDSLIVVTGSRISRGPEFSSPNPIVTVDASAIEASGQTNLTEFLADTPALLGSVRNIDVAGSNLPNAQLVGVNFLNLRNLGTGRTLVLVDGKRHVAGYPGSAAVDVNTIPTDLVQSVDVLTGGVSAVYGADGVSGVVNFRLKRDFEGLSLRAQNGISKRGDAGERFAGVTVGRNFADGRGNIALAYEFNQSDRFRQRARLNYGLTGPSYGFAENPAEGSPGSADDNPNVPDRILFTDLRWADSSRGGAVDLDLDSVPDFTGEGRPYNLGEYVAGSPFTIGGDSTPRESYYGDFTPYSHRHIANFIASYEVSSAFKLRAEAKYVRSKAETESQPSYDLYTYLAPDNAYLIERFGANSVVDGAFVSRDNFDFGTRNYELDRELFRAVLGAEGELSQHLRYDASFVFGQSIQKSTSYNERISDRYFAALDAVSDGNGGVTCRINLPGETEVSSFTYGAEPFNGAPVTFNPGQCVPLNILGEGSPSQAALDFILADHSDYAKIRQYVASFAISGDTGGFFKLPGGPVGFAIGAEYRKETSYYRPSQLVQDAALLDTSSSKIEDGQFDVKEAFAEINLPILANVPFAKQLSLGGALRLSDYSTVGSTTTWNINGNWSPISDISFRGTYSSSVRAPSISELFAPQGGTYEFIIDPCGIDRLGEGSEYRAANCEAALDSLGVAAATFNPADSAFSPQNSSLLGTQGGNKNLGAETAKTWTAGVVLRPRFIPNLSVSVDWYDIKLEDAINYASAQNIVDLCYDQPTLQNEYCGLISRSASNGFINNYSVVPANVAEYRTAGLDLNMLYQVKLSDKLGSLKFRIVGNYLDKLNFVPMIGADSENELDSSVYPAPRYSGTFDMMWSKGPLSINYGINWADNTRRVTREQEKANPDYLPAQYFWYSEKWEHELNVTLDVSDKFTLYTGVNNLFDRKPDVGAVAYPISAVGRYFYLGVKAKMF